MNTHLTELTGIQALRAILHGEAPAPQRELHDFLGVRLTGVEPGRVTMTWCPTEALRNFAGGVHGGYIATVFDDLSCSAAASNDQPATPMLTLNLNVDFFKGIRVGESYQAHAETVHSGQTRICVLGSILRSDGRTVARAGATIVPGNPS